jgi:excinuclease UvrABC nuclease subunit
VVWGPEESDRPLYVGKANNLRRRWARQHLRNRSNTSALRRSLGVHLGLVATKLKKPERAYPEQVEERVTAFLGDCALDLRPTATPEDALRLEHDLIASLDPRLNVQRKRRAAPSSSTGSRDRPLARPLVR